MYVCICNQVNDREINRAVAAGARSLDDLSAELGVATCCGKCADHALQVLDEAVATGAAMDLATDAALA